MVSDRDCEILMMVTNAALKDEIRIFNKIARQLLFQCTLAKVHISQKFIDSFPLPKALGLSGKKFIHN
jgi:hypothetical protein